MPSHSAWQGEVESFDLRALPDTSLAEIHAFEEVMDAEATPEDPARSVENYIAAVRSIPSFIDIQGLLVRDSLGAVAGEAECVLIRTDDNPHLAQLSIAVRTDLRGRGIARSLLAAGVDSAEADGRSLFVGVTNDRVPAGEAFARRIGAVAVNTSHVNRLRLADVDRARLTAWIDEGPVRGSSYSLVALDGRLPEAIVDEVASLLDVMNDAPSGSSEVADRHTTAAHLREWEEQTAASGGVQWWIFVRHSASGALVGLTEIKWNPSRRLTIHQGDTGVVKEHRGHALGKWMKAAMLRRILEECPDAVDVRTNNADSNAAMLGINRQLGFEHYIAQTTWHADLSALHKYLES